MRDLTLEERDAVDILRKLIFYARKVYNLKYYDIFQEKPQTDSKITESVDQDGDQGDDISEEIKGII